MENSGWSLGTDFTTGATYDILAVKFTGSSADLGEILVMFQHYSSLKCLSFEVEVKIQFSDFGLL